MKARMRPTLDGKGTDLVVSLTEILEADSLSWPSSSRGVCRALTLRTDAT